MADRVAREPEAMPFVERAANSPRRARRDPRTASIEGLHRDLEALPFFAHQIRFGELHVLEEHVGGVARALAELVLFLAHRDAGRVARNHEAGDTLVAILDLADTAEDRVPTGE